MAEIAEINGIAVGSILQVNGIAKSALTNVQGFTFPAAASGTPTTFLTKVSDNWTATTHGLGRLPTNWRSIAGDTVFGSTNSDRPWTSYGGQRTFSNNTGPDDGHDSSRSDGQELNSDDYLYCETSNPGFPNKRFLARTPELDFTNALANSTLKLEFWFHAFGATIGNFGVSATDNSNSAGDDTLGLHFTSDTAGGCTIVYWDDASDDGSSTASGVRITGQQQTQGDDDVGNDDRSHWRKATVDLNSVAGQSSVYLWFFHKGGSSFTGDFAIDDVVVTGEE